MFKKTRVIARSNLPVQGKLIILALIYVLYSRSFEIPPILDIGIKVLFVVGVIVEIGVFISQQPVELFEDGDVVDDEIEEK